MSTDILTTQPRDVATESSPEGIFLPELESTTERRAPEFLAAYSVMLCDAHCPVGKLRSDSGHKLCAAEILQRDGNTFTPAVAQGFANATETCRASLQQGGPMPVHQVM